MSFMGMVPFGSLLAGSLAAVMGAPATLLMSGILVILGSIVFAYNLPAMRKEVRVIYKRLGILPELSSALRTVTHPTMPPEE